MRRLAAKQKTSKGAPAYSRYVNRRAGRYLAAAAYHLGLTPNAVTALSAVASFAGIALVALVAPSWSLAVGVAALLVVGYALDAADGQLARLRGGGSTSGEWLDHMIDAAKISSLHLAVLIGAYRFLVPSLDLPTSWLLVPIGFTVVAAVLFFGMILNDQLRRARGGADGQAVAAAGSEPSRLRSLAVAPTDYGLLCLVFVLLGAPAAFVVAYTVLFVAHAGFLALAAPKWFRDMGALDQTRTSSTPEVTR